MNENLYKYEKELRKQGLNNIAGIDEAGRGPLYGPVTAACVVLPKSFKLDILNDSKKLSEKNRDICYDYIIKNASYYHIEVIDAKTIDKINILESTKVAMINSLNKVNNKIKIDHVLIDAVKLETNIPSTSIIKGDSKSITIAAASVLAKVYRDKLLYKDDLLYPEYGFKNHKGYGTKKHIEAIKKYGVLPKHRKTFKPVSEVTKTYEKN